MGRGDEDEDEDETDCDSGSCISYFLRTEAINNGRSRIGFIELLLLLHHHPLPQDKKEQHQMRFRKL